MPPKKSSTDEFKIRVFNKHGNKVEVLSEYMGGTEPINIMYHCDKHGIKYKTVNAKNIFSSSFQPCDECNIENKSKSGKERQPTKDKQSYYNRLKSHIENKGGKLLSPKWITAKSKYKVLCENNHIFEPTADSLFSKKQWCPYCYGRKGNFEDEMKEIIESKNGELLNHYINSNTHLRVKCNIHNYEWDIMPLNIRKGRWCPVCSINYAEKVVFDYLTNNNYLARVQYSIYDLISEHGDPLKFDFAIVDCNNKLLGLIEVDDVEHRYNTTQPRRIEARERDRMKDDYCKKNNIKLYRMVYKNCNKDFLNYEWYYSYIHNELYDYLASL